MWSKEADLCADFSASLGKEWTAYNETAGFDILLVHKSSVQIGIEAKLTLNPKVLRQVIQGRWRCGPGPDFRAVLVGKTNPDLVEIARSLNVTVITLGRWYSSYRGKFPYRIAPEMPELRRVDYGAGQNRWVWQKKDTWFDEVPEERLRLPEYVPDVPAGTPAPVTLSEWQIKAIKVCIFVERNGWIVRAHFRKLGIDPGRWMTGHYLAKGEARGQWVAGPHFPADQFRVKHPSVFPQIEADWEFWRPDKEKSDG